MRGQEYLFGIVPKEKWDNCFIWAFGDDMAVLQTNKAPERWNKRHGELFTVCDSDPIKESTEKIGKAYMKDKSVIKGKIEC